jgi:hypothetical protein
MELDTIGIDLGQTVFHLVGLSRAGELPTNRPEPSRILVSAESSSRKE